ncbi:MAG: NADH-quinone oxidoreductase subunit J [Candidatus Omnitrophica bacterium]|nr:NADH-quinone oxidoreductase subunit J [Candidatus Omnitrophota bacterium]
MLETVFFYLFSLGALVFALGVVLARSAVYSVLSLVGAMCMTAGLFVLLKAFLVATILVLVYAGAILVLFLFVVMMIDFKKLSEGWDGLRLPPVMAVLLGALVFAQTFGVIRSLPASGTTAAHGTAEAIGRLLFSRYALPFELTSFLLLAAILSVVILAKKEAR